MGAGGKLRGNYMGAGNSIKAAFRVLKNVSAKILKFTNYLFSRR